VVSQRRARPLSGAPNMLTKLDTNAVTHPDDLQSRPLTEQVLLSDGRQIEVARATPELPAVEVSIPVDKPPRWTGQHLQFNTDGQQVKLVEKPKPYHQPSMSKVWAKDALQPDPICAHCEKSFKGRSDAKTCSPRCRVALYRTKKSAPPTDTKTAEPPQLRRHLLRHQPQQPRRSRH
jgi:hypothetical protein